MALKENLISITDNENTLEFRIVQMPASKLESWLIRVGIALGKNSTSQHGIGRWLAELAASLANGPGPGNLDHLFYILGCLDYTLAQPLLDEMLACCWRVRDDGTEEQVRPSTLDGYIEEVTTLFKLRQAVVVLNLGFIAAAGPLSFQTTSNRN